MQIDGGHLLATEVEIQYGDKRPLVGDKVESQVDARRGTKNTKASAVEGLLTGDWLKIKCVRSESFMVVGYEQSAAARGGIGSLLLAARRGNDWIYVGAVGTGFKAKDAAALKKSLDTLKTRAPVVPLKGKNYVFAQPTLIAEIEFRGWTDDGNLRHASHKAFGKFSIMLRFYALD